MVGMVVTISPNFSLYRIVVFPAASKPTATERGTGMEMRAREPPRAQGRGEAKKPMLTGAESPGASRCAVLSTFGALRAVGVGSANSCPQSGRGAAED